MKIYTGDDGKPIIVSGAFGFSGPHCAGVIEDIFQIGGGEHMVRYVGCNYAFKGVLEKGKLEAIYAAKRIVSGIPRSLSNKWTMAFFTVIGIPATLLLIVIPKKIRYQIIQSIWGYFLDVGYMSMEHHIIIPSAYNWPIKELWRTSDIVIRKNVKSEKVIVLFFKTLSIICMILQFDISYRLRYQDIIPLIDKKLFEKDPKKEIKRVFDIFLIRELSDMVKRTGKTLRFVIDVVMMSKKVRNIMREFVRELDMERIRMDESDWYYSLDRPDYDFKGMKYEDREKWYAYGEKPYLFGTAFIESSYFLFVVQNNF